MSFGVIFDNDGVLINTVPIIWNAFKRELLNHAIILEDRDLPHYRGVSWKDTLVMFKQKYGVDIPFDVFSTKIFAEEQAHLSDKIVNPGVTRLLEELSCLRVPLAVGTSAKRAQAEEKLQSSGLRDYFHAVVTADDVPEHKPSPHVFLEAARRIGVPPEKCIVFEDGLNGIIAARRAGMKSIGYAPDPADRIALREADVVISHFSEVSIPLLQSFVR